MAVLFFSSIAFEGKGGVARLLIRGSARTIRWELSNGVRSFFLRGSHFSRSPKSVVLIVDFYFKGNPRVN